MTSNIAGLIREGVSALRDGRKEEALVLLTRATELDERNEEAWLWLSAAVDTLENQQICLENVLAVNPDNTRALQGLEMIKRELSKKGSAGPGGSPAAAQPEPELSMASKPSFGVTPPAADPPSDDEYDAWVEGLNLGGDEVQDLPVSEPAAGMMSSDPFGFDSGPFQQNDNFIEPVEQAAANAYVPPIEEPAVDAFDAFMSPEPAPAEVAPQQGFDPFALPQTPSYDAPADDVDEFGEEPDYETFDDYAASLESDGEFTSASPFAQASEDEDYQDATDLLRFLEFVPDEIKATHLPGQGRTYPRLLLLGLALTSTGVVAALAALIIQLTSR